MWIKEKNLDFVDIAELINKKTGTLPIFDTSGWTPTHKKLQQRAERIAQYYSKPSNMKKLWE